MENSFLTWFQEQFTVQLFKPHAQTVAGRQRCDSDPTAEAQAPKMSQRHSVPHTLTEPWMLAGLPRLQECNILLPVPACMVSYCGDTNFCSMMSQLPSLWKVSLDIFIFLRQTVPASSPQSPSHHLPQSIHQTFKLLLESGSSKKPKTWGFPNPLSFPAFKNH